MIQIMYSFTALKPIWAPQPSETLLNFFCRGNTEFHFIIVHNEVLAASPSDKHPYLPSVFRESTLVPCVPPMFLPMFHYAFEPRPLHSAQVIHELQIQIRSEWSIHWNLLCSLPPRARLAFYLWSLWPFSCLLLAASDAVIDNLAKEGFDRYWKAGKLTAEF